MQWTNGPELLGDPPLDMPERLNFYREQNLKCDMFKSENEFFINGRELERQLAVKYKLLVKESKKERPPNQGFNKLRGKFDIPFETEQYKEWVKICFKNNLNCINY